MKTDKQKLNLLALESSTAACSVALLIDVKREEGEKANENKNQSDGERIEQIYAEGVNLHSTHMLGMVNELLSKNNTSLEQLDAIACGVGPGGFTGLRIGVGIAQGLAFSHQLPVVPISSLDALAAAAVDSLDISADGSVNIYAGLDARMSEFYWCVYRSAYQKGSASLTRLTDYQLNKPEEFTKAKQSQVNIPSEKGENTVYIGNAWSVYGSRLAESVNQNRVNGVIDIDRANGLFSGAEVDHRQAEVDHNRAEGSIDLPQAKYIAALAKQRFLKGEHINATDLAPLYVRNDVAKKSTKNVLIT